MLPKLAFTCKFFSDSASMQRGGLTSETRQEWAVYLIPATFPTHVLVNILNI